MRIGRSRCSRTIWRLTRRSIAARHRRSSSLLAASGPDSESALEALRIRIRLHLRRELWARAILEAQDLVAAEEALSGSTSGRYLSALATEADVYRVSGNLESAADLMRRVVEIADRMPDGAQRACVRATATPVLAGAGRFEEAERLAAEAAALDSSFTPNLNAVRLMKAGKRSGWIACGIGL